MKIVKFYVNIDSAHCLQACVKMLLSFYFPKKKFEDDEIDHKTLQEGGHTWLPPAACWLDELGLRVELFCPSSGFSYKTFAEKGDQYLKQKWFIERYDREKNSGALKNISKVQNASKAMVSKGLWAPKRLDEDKLTQILNNNEALAIGKTIHEWLSGNYVRRGTGHYVLIQKRYSPSQWRIHDPGLPAVKNRKVSLTINDRSIFGEALVVYGHKK